MCKKKKLTYRSYASIDNIMVLIVPQIKWCFILSTEIVNWMASLSRSFFNKDFCWNSDEVLKSNFMNVRLMKMILWIMHTSWLEVSTNFETFLLYWITILLWISIKIKSILWIFVCDSIRGTRSRRILKFNFVFIDFFFKWNHKTRHLTLRINNY